MSDTQLTMDKFLQDVLGSLLPSLPDGKPVDWLAAAFAAPAAAPAAGAAPAAAPADPAKAKAAEQANHFLQLLGVLICNLDYAKRVQPGEADQGEYFIDKKTFTDILARINELVAGQLNEVFHHPALRDMEGKWRSIMQLVDKTSFSSNIGISLLDATKEELGEDLSMNMADIAGSELYKKVYVSEYDQLGGEPYGAMIGLYDFENSYRDRIFLRAMATVCKQGHVPFVASASPRLFGLDELGELMRIRDVAAKFDDQWNGLRESEEFAYIGLTVPRYIVRAPYTRESPEGGVVRFDEKPISEKHLATRYAWGSSAMLFARNLVRSFQNAGWCQYIRGVKGGGLIEGLARIPLEGGDGHELRSPIEVVIPDYAELALAEAGLIPIVHKKGTTDAVFFSCQSIKRPSFGADPRISENSQLTTNLAYTYSISRIAHYLKRMLRNNVGSSADANYIKAQIDTWISRYVTTIVNPDDLTLRYYPFKAYALEVRDVPGRAGWYDATLTIQPHIQFEGMDVTLRVDARLS